MVRGFERGQRDTGINDLSQTTQEQEMVVVGLQEMKDSLQKKENELKEYEAIEDKDSRTNKAIKQLKREIEEFKKYIESNGKTGHDNESVQKIEPKQSPVLEQAKVTDVENVEENILVNRGEAKKPEKTLEDYPYAVAAVVKGLKLNDEKSKNGESGGGRLEPFANFIKTAKDGEELARAKNNLSELAVWTKNAGSNFFLGDKLLKLTLKKGFDTLFSTRHLPNSAARVAHLSFWAGLEGIGPPLEDLESPGLPLTYSPKQLLIIL